MKPVSKEEFFKPIFADGLDVHPSIVSAFPYTSVWEFHRMLRKTAYGKTVDRIEGGKIVTDYFIEVA